jgi:hypothetical protein
VRLIERSTVPDRGDRIQDLEWRRRDESLSDSGMIIIPDEPPLIQLIFNLPVGSVIVLSATSLFILALFFKRT